MDVLFAAGKARKPKALTHTAECNEYARYTDPSCCICHPRKPKAQRERVVVAYAVVCVGGRYFGGGFVQQQEAKNSAMDLDDQAESLCCDGPHRVVRLEGRVKI